MRVKDLIKYLEAKDPEAIVGILDLGQDTGDFVPLKLEGDDSDNNMTMLHNLRIYDYNEVIEYMEKNHQSYDIPEFKRVYGK